MKAVFIADAHISGKDDPRLKSLVSFLDRLKDIDTLIILGDLFDFIALDNKIALAEYKSALGALERLRNRGVRVIYLEGNHDFALGSYFKDKLGIEVYPDFFEATIDDKRILFTHGDIVEKALGYRAWRAFLRSPLYLLLNAVLPDKFIWRTANGLSNRSRKYSVSLKAKTEEALKEFAKKKIAEGFDVVVAGHSHAPGVARMEANGRMGTYANPGGFDGRRHLFCKPGFKMEVRG